MRKEYSAFCFLLFTFCFLLFNACRTAKKITETKPLEEQKIDALIQKMDSGKFDCEWLSVKISAAYNSASSGNSFSAVLRMRKDSVIWISISSLGIEAARIYLAKDTMKYMDRLNSRYAVSGYDSLNNLFRLSVDFDMLQSLLLGNFFSYTDKKELKSAYIDGQYYILSTLRKRKLKRALEEKEPNKRIIQDVWLDPLSFRIVKMSVDDNRIRQKLTVAYENFRSAEVEGAGRDAGKPLAHKTTLRINSEKPMTITLEYSKVFINKPQEFPFTIPEKYELMK